MIDVTAIVKVKVSEELASSTTFYFPLQKIVQIAKENGADLSVNRAREKFYDALKELREVQGLHIIADREKGSGWYRLRSLDEAVHRVVDTNRLAVVKKARRGVREVVGIQHAPGVPDEMRVRLNHEEARMTRGLMHVEAAYLKRQRKLEKSAPGLEED